MFLLVSSYLRGVLLLYCSYYNTTDSTVQQYAHGMISVVVFGDIVFQPAAVVLPDTYWVSSRHHMDSKSHVLF